MPDILNKRTYSKRVIGKISFTCSQCDKIFERPFVHGNRALNPKCSRACVYESNRSNPFERFKRQSLLNNETRCIEWNGTRNSGGYGVLSFNGKMMLAHRFSYEIHNDAKIPENMDVLHKCDNPACVTSEHLFLGTHTDNMRDMAAKKRSAAQNGKNARAKLTKIDVLNIRKNTILSTKELAEKYSVDRVTIRYALKGKTWKDV